ncbi:MAG: hypothetical protein M5U34_43355 [Chloroflexi bacterium]|nr:hypothetical protein [Chloroflexota bacterium]
MVGIGAHIQDVAVWYTLDFVGNGLVNFRERPLLKFRHTLHNLFHLSCSSYDKLVLFGLYHERIDMANEGWNFWAFSK